LEVFLNLCIFEFFGLLLLFLPFDLCAANMIFGKVALLAFAHRIEKTVGMTTLGGVLLPSKPLIARRTHIFRVVLSVWVWAGCHRLGLVPDLLLLGPLDGQAEAISGLMGCHLGLKAPG